MAMQETRTGLPGIGDVPWGSHFCQFYSTAEELADGLVPFFKTGIENNEQCVWVTSEPLGAEAARAALRAAVPDLDERLARGQIAIVDFDRFYTAGAAQDIDAVLNDWMAREERALALGYTGLRASGNTCWITCREEWRTFADYEAKVNACFCDHRIVAMCSYHLGRCSGADAIEVMRNHQFAISRQSGEWSMVESARLKTAKDELRRANQSLERRVAERTEQLHESEVRFRGLLEALPAAFYTTDAAGRITYYNRAAVEMAGRTPTLGSDEWCVTWRLHHPDGRPMRHDECPMAVALKENRPIRGEEAVAERPDGRRVPFMAYPTPLHDAAGALIGAANMLVDITDRKRAEAALRVRTQELEVVLETVPTAVWFTRDPAAARITGNGAAAKLLGIPEERNVSLTAPEQERPAHFRVFVDGVEAAPESLPMQRAARGEEVHGVEQELRFADGRSVSVISHAAPLRDGAGQVIGAVCAATDITARKRTEAKVVGQKRILEMVATGAPEAEALDELMRFLEAQEQGVRCGLLIVTDDGGHLRRGSAPSLPEAYAALEGVPIGPPYVGSCGECVHCGTSIIVPDLAAEARYPEAFCKLLRSHGIGAVRSDPVRGSDGRVLASLAMHFDRPRVPEPADPELIDLATHLAAIVLERGRAERLLRASEARFRQVFEQANVGMVLMDRDCRLSAVNAAFCKITGRTEAELIGNSCLTFTHPDDVAENLRLVRELMDGGRETVTFEKRYVGVNGRQSWVCINIGRLGGSELIAIVEDVTERVQAIELLRESDARLQLLADNINQFAWMAEPDGAIFWYNKRWYDYTGTTFEQMRGWGWRAVHHPDQVERVVAEVRRNWAAGQPWQGMYLLRSASGEYRWFLTRAEPLRNAKGEIVRWLGTNTDVTEQRRTEQALRELTATLEKRIEAAVSEREAAQQQLAHAQRMEALGQLAGGIAHDFNNVLQAVQGGSALIERRPGDAESVRRLARLVGEAAGRGAAVTRRLLAFSRQGDLRAEPIDAAELLADMREILSHTLGAGIEVRLTAPAGPPPLMADKGQLETVLVNLATNARDAMAEGGTLTLGAAAETVWNNDGGAHPANLKPGSYVRLWVGDTGAGMDATTLARVPEPFFTTKPRGKGTGLGLAMASGFAEQSGGGLHIASEPGSGTTVTLWFPAAEGVTRQAGPDGAADAHARVETRARVLLVDDDAVVLETVAEQLEAAGYAVLAARSGSAALALLDAGEAVDLVVSDLSMPGIGGVALIREAQRRRPGLAAILLTGFASKAAEIAVGGAVSGAFSLLRKPIEGKHLIERIGALLEPAPSG